MGSSKGHQPKSQIAVIDVFLPEEADFRYLMSCTRFYRNTMIAVNNEIGLTRFLSFYLSTSCFFKAKDLLEGELGSFHF